MDLIFQICGWIGALGLLTAFFLNSRDIITTDSKTYQWLNLISALILTLNAYHANAYQFIVINVFWAAVALLGLMSSQKEVAVE